MIIRDKYRVVSGKDFACGACGACCRLYSLVDLHITDVFRMAEKLGIAPKEFFEKYCKVIKDKDENFTFAMDIEGGCRFQKDNRCIVYEARSDFCAFYPNSHTCFDLSQVQKNEMKTGNPGCAAHKQADGLILVPDLERMVDSRIFYMVKEMYLARYGGVFDEGGMAAAHKSGLAQVANGRMREIVHLQILNEIIENAPVDPETKEPALTRDEIIQIYKKMRHVQAAGPGQ
jgi:Fe-S-cluster containining protein